MKVGTWVERLEAVAIGREVVAVAGKRDAAAVFTSRVHVLPVSLLDDKGDAWALDATSAVLALAFAGDDLLLAGGDDGTLVAWDVTGKKKLAELALGSSIRALATDSAVARGDAGTIVVGTANGAIHVLALAITSGSPKLSSVAKHPVSDGPIQAIALDPAGVWVCGGADGQLRVLAQPRSGELPHNIRAVSPGGDGGIRAVACVGDGRAVVGCGDGSIRSCFIVGDVEAHDRSGDHGHQAAVTGLVLGPVIVDDAGREQPRRLFSVGEDGALKCWFVDGARRPKTIELGIGPAMAIALAPGPVPKLDKAVGRLWIAGTNRKVCALPLTAEVEPEAIRSRSAGSSTATKRRFAMPRPPSR